MLVGEAEGTHRTARIVAEAQKWRERTSATLRRPTSPWLRNQGLHRRLRRRRSRGVGGRWPVSGEVAYLLGPPKRHTDSRGAPNDAYLAVNESTAPHAKTTSDLAQINKVGVPNVIATAVLSNVGDAEESIPEPRIQASLHVFHSRSLMLTSSFGAACFKAGLSSVS
jgi:hypothetical protein